MKVCPTCRTRFDGSQSYCPHDGDELVDARALSPGKLTGLDLDDAIHLESLESSDGLGERYRAALLDTGQPVRVTVFNQGRVPDQGRQRILEAALDELDAPLPDPILDLVSLHLDTDTPHVVEQAPDGPSLGSVLESRKALDWTIAVRLTCAVGRILQYLADRDIIIRGLHPKAIFVTDLQEGRVQLGEWAHDLLSHRSRPLEVAEQSPHTFLGHPAYMAPEVIRDATDACQQSLVYSMGLLLYELIVGKPPFTSPSPAATLKRHLHEKPLKLSIAQGGAGLNPGIDDVLDMMWLKAADRRFQSPTAAIGALSSLLETAPDDVAAPLTPQSNEPAPTEAPEAADTRADPQPESSGRERTLPGEPRQTIAGMPPVTVAESEENSSSTSETSPAETSTGQTDADETSPAEPSSDQTNADETADDEADADQTATDQTSTGESEATLEDADGSARGRPSEGATDDQTPSIIIDDSKLRPDGPDDETSTDNQPSLRAVEGDPTAASDPDQRPASIDAVPDTETDQDSSAKKTLVMGSVSTPAAGSDPDDEGESSACQDNPPSDNADAGVRSNSAGEPNTRLFGPVVDDADPQDTADPSEPSNSSESSETSGSSPEPDSAATDRPDLPNKDPKATMKLSASDVENDGGSQMNDEWFDAQVNDGWDEASVAEKRDAADNLRKYITAAVLAALVIGAVLLYVVVEGGYDDPDADPTPVTRSDAPKRQIGGPPQAPPTAGGDPAGLEASPTPKDPPPRHANLQAGDKQPPTGDPADRHPQQPANNDSSTPGEDETEAARPAAVHHADKSTRSVDDLLEQAQQDRRAGHKEEARTLYTRVLSRSPSNYSAHTHLGDLLFHNAEYSAALVHHRKAALLRPNSAQDAIKLGRTHYRLGHYRKARDAWANALRDDPDNQMARRYMTLVKKKL